MARTSRYRPPEASWKYTTGRLISGHDQAGDV
jgi:hypothetical protein